MTEAQGLKEAKACLKAAPWDEEACRVFLESPWPKVRGFALEHQAAQREEKDRLKGLLAYERALWHQGCQWVAGIDEVGRGPLAGPVVAAAVIFPPGEGDLHLWGLNDSKKLSEKKRRALEPIIKEKALAWAIAWQNHRQIDALNIARATDLAMKKAADKLSIQPDFLLVDGYFVKELPQKQQALEKGDSLSLSIAAASVLAKCFRDNLMLQFDTRFPQYQWAKNKGYGSAAHRQALGEWGYSPLHRRSFVVKELAK